MSSKPTENHASNFEGVVKGIRNRATRHKKEAQLFIFLVVIVAISVVAYFTIVVIAIEKDISISAEQNIEVGGNIHFGETNLFDLIQNAILRLGAVFVAIFLMQILVSMARYRMRLAEIVDQRADLLEISGNDLERIKALSDVLAFDSLDFGSLPKNPYDKTFQAISDFAAKMADGRP